MARLTIQQEKELIADWKTGHYSHRDLLKKYNCSKGKVSQLTQGIEKASNDQLVKNQVSILSASATLPKEEMTAIMTTAQEIAFNKGLVFGVTQKALQKLNVMIDNVDNPNDMKAIIDASDRASLTLGVNQRHAPKVEVQQNNQQLIQEIVISEA